MSNVQMEEIREEVDLEQFVNQPVPEDPEKLRLSLIFSKDLITTLQQDIADLHHRLHIADTEYDGTQDLEEDEEDDFRAGIHVTNATLTKMDGDGLKENLEIDLYENTNSNIIKRNLMNSRSNNNVSNLYEMSEDDNYDNNNNNNLSNQMTDDLYDERADLALNKKKTDHEKFFSTYNILSKQINTGQALIESMGSFQSLIYLSDNAVTFNKIILNLQLRLRTARDAFIMVRDALDGIGVDIDIDNDNDDNNYNDNGSLSDEDEDDLEKKLFISNAKEVLRESKKLVNTIDSTIDELNGAKHLIHPDQKKIFSLQTKIKELQVALPVHKIKKLAILNELPRFIKQELSDAKIQKQAEEARQLQQLREARKGHKKKRTKTLVDDDIPDIDIGDFKYREDDNNNNENNDNNEYDSEKEAETRIENFNSTMDGVTTCIDTLQSRLVNINDTIEAMDNDLEAMDDPAAELLKNSIGDIKDEMKTCEDKAHDIVLYFKQAKEYVHPTQNVLVTAINQYIEQKTQNDALQKQIDILQGELSAKDNQINILKKENNISSNGNGNDNDNDDDDVYNEIEKTQDFVQTVAKQLRELSDKSLNIHNSLKQPLDDNDEYDNKELKNKTSLSFDEIRLMDNNLNNFRDILADLSARLMNDDYSVLKLTPTNEYILNLEKRYLNLKKLYRLKFTELEKAKDNVIYNESLLETKNEEIDELESRLIRIMTSASSSAETRLEAINTMGYKSQTYRTVMDLIDDNLRTTSSALHEIEKLTKSNKIQSKIDQTDSKDIQNYCKTIKKGLQAVHQEMNGARNFVHPDREMVQSLQEQILEQNKQQSESAQPQEIEQQEEEEEEPEQQEEDTFDESYQPSTTTTTKSKVHFKSKTSTMNSGSSSYNRRTKSVHEIAWSKFNAGHETNMEDLQKKEREVLEEEIREQILSEFQQQYDDAFDKKVAEIRAQLTQDIREKIRLEYEDLEAQISSNAYQSQQEPQQQQQPPPKEPTPEPSPEPSPEPTPPPQQQEQEQEPPQQPPQPQIDIAALTSKLESEYDNRLEAEKQKIEEYYGKNEATLNSQIESLTTSNQELQKENSNMQTEINKLQQNENKYKKEVEEVSDSKLKLILSTSAEIDALRYKIKMYTQGNWEGVISSNDKRNGYY